MPASRAVVGLAAATVFGPRVHQRAPLVQQIAPLPNGAMNDETSPVVARRHRYRRDRRAVTIRQYNQFYRACSVALDWEISLVITPFLAKYPRIAEGSALHSGPIEIALIASLTESV